MSTSINNVANGLTSERPLEMTLQMSNIETELEDEGLRHIPKFLRAGVRSLNSKSLIL